MIRQLRVLPAAMVCGVLAGSAGAFFLWSLDAVTRVRGGHRWLVVALPASGLLMGLVFGRWAGRTRAGTRLVMEQAAELTSGVPPEMAPLALGGTLITHLFGGSAGREGVAVQMTAGLTDPLFARVLGREDRRILIGASIAGAFGAVFGVPWAGVVFALEAPAVGFSQRWRPAPAAVVSALVAHRLVDLLGEHHHRYGPQRGSAADLARMVVGGVVFGLVARAFLVALGWVRRRGADRPPATRAALGGAVVVGLWLLVGDDYLGLSVPLLYGATAGAAVAGGAFALKATLTAVTVGSGFPGGEVTPLLVVGATLGSALAAQCGWSTGLFASVGAVALFGAGFNAPLAATVMGMELFGWRAGLICAVGCGVASLVSGRRSVYSGDARRLVAIGR